jgi:hypothetical protein
VRAREEKVPSRRNLSERKIGTNFPLVSPSCKIVPDRVCRILAGFATGFAGFWRVERRGLPDSGGLEGSKILEEHSLKWPEITSETAKEL